MSTQVLSYDYQTAKYGRISPTGSVIASEPKRLVGGGFAGSLDVGQWTANNAGTASAVNVTNQAQLVPGTASGGYAAIQTITRSRFLFASANNFRGTFRVAALGVANCLQQWGAINFGALPAIQDGFYFAFDGASFSVNAVSSGVITQSSSSGSFNGELPPTYTLDTNAHNYEIIYQVAGVWFLVDGKLLHSMKPTTVQLASTLTLAASAIVTNPSASAGANLEVWAMSLVRFGSTDSATQIGLVSANGTQTFKMGPGFLQNIFVGSPGSGGNSVTVYDSTTGAGKVITSMASGVSGGRVGYDFINGLTVVSAGGTAGSYSFIFE